MLNGLVWALIAAGLTIGLAVYAMQPDNEKRNFYLLAAALAGLATLINVWWVYLGYQQIRQARPPGSPAPPTSPDASSPSAHT